MVQHNEYSLNIYPLWSVVKWIRKKVEAILTVYSDDLGYAGKMVTSELIENAMKYGVPVDALQNQGIGYVLDVDIDNGKTVTITVTNKVASEKDSNEVVRHIKMIRESNDPQQLYIERLTALIDTPGQGGSQLGLFRIAYEGQFDLEYELTDDLLSIIATRKVSLSPIQKST